VTENSTRHGRIWRTPMGREAICNCTFNGTTAKVKALLESEELILGGKIRMRAPFRALKDSHLAHLPQGPRTPAQRIRHPHHSPRQWPHGHESSLGLSRTDRSPLQPSKTDKRQRRNSDKRDKNEIRKDQAKTITSALISLYPIDHCYAFGVIAQPTSASAVPTNPAAHPQ
jgi:hypothetical protein